MSLEIDSQRFLIDGVHSSAQFFELYKHRLDQIAPFIIPHLDPPFCKHINELIPGKECSIVGVLYKELAKRKDVLKDYMEIGTDSQTEDLSVSEDDQIYIEDTTGRLKLVDIDPQQFPTGVVVGLHGQSETSKFHVDLVYTPILPPANPLPALNSNDKILFVSDLACDNKKHFSNAKKLALDAANHSLLVLLGNNFEAPAKPDQDEVHSFRVKMSLQSNMPIQALKSFLKFANSRTIIMPGANDPTSIRLPQLPYHRCLINQENLELVTNPASFNYQGLNFLCGSGESPVDISKTTSLTFHEAQESILKWAHYAPTAPDHLPTVPLEKKDILVLEEMPNVFICGLADQFSETKIGETFVVSVPSFNKTLSAVSFDMETLEFTLKSYE